MKNSGEIFLSVVQFSCLVHVQSHVQVITSWLSKGLFLPPPWAPREPRVALCFAVLPSSDPRSLPQLLALSQDLNWQLFLVVLVLVKTGTWGNVPCFVFSISMCIQHPSSLPASSCLVIANWKWFKSPDHLLRGVWDVNLILIRKEMFCPG